MTTLDLFAAAALPALVAKYTNVEEKAAHIARLANLIAEEMELIRLKRENNQPITSPDYHYEL